MKPFDEIKSIRRRSLKPRRNLSRVTVRLPKATVEWITNTAKTNKIPLEAMYSSLLIEGIQTFERENPFADLTA